MDEMYHLDQPPEEFYAAADAIRAQAARIAELKAALLPFAAIADESTANLADNYMYPDCYPMSAFRAARAAYLGTRDAEKRDP
jgi:hypothetical protein